MSYCNFYSINCTVNAAGTACIGNRHGCSSFTVRENCGMSSGEGKCHWSAATNGCIPLSSAWCIDFAGTSLSECKAIRNSCKLAASGTACEADCAAATAPFDYNSCKAHDIKCTVKTDATACVAMVDTCANTASTIVNCTSSL